MGSSSSFLFFFNDTATTEIYTLSLHDALPILMSFQAASAVALAISAVRRSVGNLCTTPPGTSCRQRSEEHTSELQSRQYLVCRLLLEKKRHGHTPAEIASVSYIHATVYKRAHI